MRLGRILLLFALCTALLSSSGEAARVRRVGLADMAARAGRIFSGRCVETTTSIDPTTGLPVTTYTFAVTDPIKGVGPGQTTFRIPGTPGEPFFAGLPIFRRGEEALLVLYPESAAGFSTPIGMDQGRFRILSGPHGSPHAVNDTGNELLLADVPEPLLKAHGFSRKSRGPLDLDRIAALLRDLASGSGR